MGDRQTYTYPWGAQLDGYEEHGIWCAVTRDFAIATALNMYADEMEAGWEGEGQHILTVYTSPTFCAGDPSGEYQCPCGGDHADGDTMLSHEGSETLIVRGRYDGDDAVVEVVGD